MKISDFTFKQRCIAAWKLNNLRSLKEKSDDTHQKISDRILLEIDKKVSFSAVEKRGIFPHFRKPSVHVRIGRPTDVPMEFEKLYSDESRTPVLFNSSLPLSSAMVLNRPSEKFFRTKILKEDRKEKPSLDFVQSVESIREYHPAYFVSETR